MMKRTLHTTLLLALVLLPLSCRREPPVGTEAFRLEFPLPEDCLPDAFYAGRKVTLRGPLEYTFETDARGGVNVESVIPGIYDIVTGIELSGAEYKALLRVPVALEDNAQVHIGASRMNCRIFEAADLRIPLSASVLKSLLIAKIYYSGTRDNMDRTYTTDSYVEIFNNSDEVQYMDGKYLGLAESVSPAAYPAKDNPDSIYLRQVCRFPGKGTDYPVAPGGSVVIAARSARDHRTSAATSVDLSGADFDVLAWPEVYQRGKTSGEMFRRMHRKFVTDGVECLRKPAQTAPDVNTKRLQGDIDAGYIVITAVNGYNHESVERKVARFEGGRYYLTDTNNSSADFVVCTDPTPRKYDKEGLQ